MGQKQVKFPSTPLMWAHLSEVNIHVLKSCQTLAQIKSFATLAHLRLDDFCGGSLSCALMLKRITVVSPIIQ